LDFDPASSIPGDADKFVIEMAPLDLMPHAIYTFLSQVSQQLYDGCSFHRNAGHVVQGGPAPNYNTPPNAKLRKRFVDAQLESVRFQEYSEKFPHVKYTLGYAGRPGGPDFYVSTKDNTRAHGPGGQGGYADKSEADPCFAKVIEGFEAVDRMAKSPVSDQSYRHMDHNIAIRHMKILTTDSK
jgi:cyclophilin family peptidyl-prolyl cis-trans isomerase